MKKLIFSAIIAAIALISCKTSEANYRKAYETAKAKGESEAVDPEVYAQIYREAAPDTLYTEDASFPAKFMYLSYATAQGITGGEISKYNVAVATFRQLFNARDMVMRLRREGFRHAFVASDRDNNYYVIAGSSLSASEAERMLHDVGFAGAISVVKPFPYVIVRPNR